MYCQVSCFKLIIFAGLLNSGTSCSCETENCVNGCCDYQFGCGELCIDKSQFCDGIIDCSDGSDENTTGPGIMCLSDLGRMCVLPEAYACDSSIFCRNDADECGNQCAGKAYGFFCNGIEQCEDGIDECLCGKQGRDDSVYSDDKCFRCLDDSKTIPTSDFCDGTVHCKDLSDECLCGENLNLPICNQIEWDGPNMKFVCTKNGSEEILAINRICDKRTDCDSGIDEANCAKKASQVTTDDPEAYSCTEKVGLSDISVGIAVKCDGIPTCTNLADECMGCENTPEYCRYRDRSGFYCSEDRVGSMISGEQVCDGVEECGRTGRDEMFCPNSTRFYCNKTATTKNIPRDNVCDLKNDCDNANDEMNCQVDCKNCSKCKTRHFYCEAGGKEYVDCRRQVCDGSKDCANGADECQSCTVGTFSDDDRMIAAASALPFMWIIGLVATIGNVLVIGKNIEWVVLELRKNRNHVQKCQRTLILNLAAADLLVGIYTLSICIQNLNFGNDKYCQHDHEWRSSATCNALGVILTTGCEASVFILAIITVYRLNSVYRPYSKTSTRHVVLIATISWVIALIIATIPLTKSAEDYFVESKWFGNNPIVRTATREELSDFTTRLVAMKNLDSDFVAKHGGIGSWRLFERLLQTLNPDYTAQREFGYYSAHGVCLPKLFPYPQEDAAWGYSFFVLFINFLMFLHICISYFFIYKKAMGSKVLRTDEQAKRSVRLQTRITRMVVTDFLCWIPICIIAFLRLGGVRFSDEVYVPVGTIILPINSMLNPFLYSELPDWLRKKLLPIRKHICPKRSGSRPQDSVEMNRVAAGSGQTSGSDGYNTRSAATAEETLHSQLKSSVK